MDNGIRYALVRFRAASIENPSYAWAKDTDPKTDEVMEEQFEISLNFGSVTTQAKWTIVDFP